MTDDPAKDFRGSPLSQEQCNLIREAAYSYLKQEEDVCAYFDGDSFSLGSYEQAMVPASWGAGWKGGAPSDQFLSIQPPDGDDTGADKVQILPGVCCAKDLDFMMCIF